MKTSTQLKALIRNLSREKNVKAEILLRNFMLERFLERISLSKYKNQFVLKGGMLIAAIIGVDARSTMDMDTTISGFNLSDEAEYPGIRVSINASLDKTNQTMKIDITTGDQITPRAIEFPYKLMLEDRSISILSYNLETVIAEKIETILSRGTTTTRMRDYYDIHILMILHEKEIDKNILKDAFNKTSRHRSSFENIKSNGTEYIQMIEESKILSKLWDQYKSKNNYAADVKWDDAIKSVKKTFQIIK
jgi:hypothetical protein